MSDVSTISLISLSLTRTNFGISDFIDRSEGFQYLKHIGIGGISTSIPLDGQINMNLLYVCVFGFALWSNGHGLFTVLKQK